MKKTENMEYKKEENIFRFYRFLKQEQLFYLSTNTSIANKQILSSLWITHGILHEAMWITYTNWFCLCVVVPKSK